MNPAARRTLLFAALAATLVVAAWVALQEAPPQRPGKAAAVRTAPGELPGRTGLAARVPGDLRLPPQKAEGGPIVDPFVLYSPTVATARGGQGQAKPVAPPLPFVFVGRYVERGDVRVALADGEQLYLVRVGDVIEEKYRVERIDKEVSLTYLPLNAIQILAIGDM